MDNNIGQHIAEHFLENEENPVTDPVLLEWLAQSPSNIQLFEEYKKIWIEVRNVYNIESFDADTAWENVNNYNQEKKIRRRRIRSTIYALSGVAASVVLFISLFFTGYVQWTDTASDTIRMSTAYGNRSDIVLPDGTKVRLNVGTDLEYSFNKKENTREVNFKGEAFFEVAKSKAPFVINTPADLQVKVLGTTFSLAAYEDDNTIQTSLLEGKIELSNAKQKLLMEPGEIISYDKTTRQMAPAEVDISHTYGWVNNKLYMDNMSLTDVCKNLERWYDVEIDVPAEMSTKIHYTGVLQEESFIDILEALRSLSNIRYEIKGRNIKIKQK
ncbi:FecR family protein [Prevotella sp. 10(H)]|uniref:FecR family protein n=1 Tax=Prevotella sp. 10(H) TaxID=1158294 RepID=UPI0004A6E5D3|nr:FecR domain-containing protein [Prevotella sp. 10(H)]